MVKHDMDVLSQEELVEFLTENFGIDRENAVNLLKNRKRKRMVGKLLELYRTLREYNYEFRSVEYHSDRTLSNLLRILEAFRKEILLNPRLNGPKKSAVLCVLNTLDLEELMNAYGYVIILDSFVRDVGHFVNSFLSFFNELSKVTQEDDYTLSRIFCNVSSEVGSGKTLKQLLNGVRLAHETLRRCKKFDTIRLIRDTVGELLKQKTEWYDEELRDIVVGILKETDEISKRMEVCKTENIVRIIFGETPDRGNVPMPSTDEILKPLTKFVYQKIDLAEVVVNLDYSGVKRVLRLSRNDLTEIRREINKIKNSLRTDTKIAPWEVPLNAKRLDKLEMRICSSIMERIEVPLDELDTLLKAIKTLAKLCPGAGSTVTVELEARVNRT